ncbi:MAG: hypothetical protein U1A27_08330 [Phycisphaerae bacterium]
MSTFCRSVGKDSFESASTSAILRSIQMAAWTMWPTSCLVAVAEAGAVGELGGLADVVQEDAGEDEVATDLGVAAGGIVFRAEDEAGELEEVERVFEQAAEVGVVHVDGGGGGAEGVGDFLVFDEGLDEQQQVAIADGAEDGEHALPHLVDVELGAGDELAQLHLAGRHGAQAVDDELQRAFVVFAAAADANEAALGQAVVLGLGGLPDARKELAGAVGEDEVDVERAVGGGAQVFLADEEDLVVELVAGDEVGDPAAGRGIGLGGRHGWGSSEWATACCAASRDDTRPGRAAQGGRATGRTAGASGRASRRGASRGEPRIAWNDLRGDGAAGRMSA